MRWYDELLKDPKVIAQQNKMRVYYSMYGQKGYELPVQSVHSQHEYTIISQTEETIFVEDETGAPHVFTIDEWNAINGKKKDGTGFLFIAAVAAGLMLL
jgi:hypothetical protein